MSLFEKLNNKRQNIYEVKKSFPSGSFDPANQEGKFVKNEKNKRLSSTNKKEISKRLSASTTKGDQARSQYGADGGYGDSNVGDEQQNKSKVNTKAKDYTNKINKQNKNRSFFDATKHKNAREKLIQGRKAYIDPKTNKASEEGIKRYITKARNMASGSNVNNKANQKAAEIISKSSSKEYADKINQKYGGRLARKRPSNAKSLEQIKREINRKNPVKPGITGQPIPAKFIKTKVTNRQIQDAIKSIPGKSKSITVGAFDKRDDAIKKIDKITIEPKPGETKKTTKLISKLEKKITKPKPGEVSKAKKIVKQFTSGVDQRQVSKKAKEFTQSVNKKNTKVTTDGYGVKKKRRGQPTYKQIAQDINKRNPTYTGISGKPLPVNKSKTLKSLDTYSKMSTSAVKRDIAKKFGEVKPKTTTYTDLAKSRSKALDKLRSIKKTLPKSARASVDLTKPLAQVRSTGAKAFYKPTIKSIPKTFKPLARPTIKQISKLKGLLKGTSGKTKLALGTVAAVTSIPLVQRLLKPKNVVKTGAVVAGGETLRRGLTPVSVNKPKIKPVDATLSLSSINKK